MIGNFLQRQFLVLCCKYDLELTLSWSKKTLFRPFWKYFVTNMGWMDYSGYVVGGLYIIVYLTAPGDLFNASASGTVSTFTNGTKLRNKTLVVWCQTLYRLHKLSLSTQHDTLKWVCRYKTFGARNLPYMMLFQFYIFIYYSNGQ